MTNDTDVRRAYESRGVSRRTLMKGAAWAAPMIALAAAAPAYAASNTVPAKGLNGWVTVERNCFIGSTYSLDGTQGSGFVTGSSSDRGIWIFAGSAAVISGATMIVYLSRSDLTFINGSGTGWSNLVRSPGDDGSAPASGFYAYKATYSGTWTYKHSTNGYVDNNGNPQSDVQVANGRPKWTADIGWQCSQITSYIRRSVIVDGTSYSFVRGPVTA